MTTLTNLFILGGRTLHAWYVTGLTDGDGHFGININRAAKKITLEFKITSHCASYGVLLDLLSFFGVGRINIDNRRDNTMKFVVSSLQDILNVVIPHFEAFPLQGSKHLNFLAFKKAAQLLDSGQHLTEEGWTQLLALAASMNKGRSFSDKFEYNLSNTRSLSMHWLLGFIDAEAMFYLYIPAEIGRQTLQFTVEIAQATHEVALLLDIAILLASGTLKPKFDTNSLTAAQGVRPVSRLIVRQGDILINFLKDNPLMTTKQLDYLDWLQMKEMYNQGLHRTPDGLAQIKAIKAGMNQGRPKCTIEDIAR